MSRRDRQEAQGTAPVGRAVMLAAGLSVVAILLVVGALVFALTRPGDATACRTVAWNAVPESGALPADWSIVSDRVFVDNLSTTLLGPAPSGSTQAPAVFLSVSCYGSDAPLALARSRDGALAAGATDATFVRLGDDSFAVHSAAANNTAVFVRRGGLVADLTAPASVDQATLEALGKAVDAAMTRALSAGPGASLAAAASPIALASPGASSASGATPSPAGPSPSQGAAAESHVAPDLEALLPYQVDGTTLSSQSILGSSALQAGASSEALVKSLQDLGKTPADLEIAEASAASGSPGLNLYAYRVRGITGSDLGKAVVDSLLADTTVSGTRSEGTVAGRLITKITYGQQGAAVYIYESSGVVFAVQAADERLAAQVLGLLK